MTAFINNFIFQNLVAPTSRAAKQPSTCYETKTPTLCFFPQFNSLVSGEAIIGGHLTYALIIYSLRKYMANRTEAYDLKTPMLVYNFTQILVSLFMVIGMLPYFLQFPNIFNINGLFTAEIEFWVLCHYLAKFLDMFDTVFIVLRKKDKQFSFLHVYHHFTIGVIWGGLLHYGVGNGTAYFGAWINSLVHALMYGHYFFSSLKFNNPLKVYLTQFQMFQFALCIVHAILVSVGMTNNYPTSVSYVQMMYHPTLLYLFYDYLMGEKRAKKIAAAQKQAITEKSPSAARSSVVEKAAAAASPRSSSKKASPAKKVSATPRGRSSSAAAKKSAAAAKKSVSASPRSSSKKKK